MNADDLQLIDDLARFDGKRTHTLQRIARARAGEPRFDERLVAASAIQHGDEVRVGATWILLRRAQESPSRLFGLEARVVGLLSDETHWEARLHLMQMLDLLDLRVALKPAQRRALMARLLTLADDKKTLIRAWAIGLLARHGAIAAVHDQRVITAVIGETERSGAASMKARLRRIRAAGDLDWMTGP